MKRSGIGEDLEAVIKGTRMMDASGTERKVLILSYLSERPCSTSYLVATELGTSERGALWHLRSMAKKDVLREVEMEKKHRFFITDHIRQEDCPVFSLLSERKPREVFRAIAENPGINHSELCELFGVSRQAMWKMVKKLVDADLIHQTREGRYVEYHLSGKAEEMAEIYMERRESAGSIIEIGLKNIGVDYSVAGHRNGTLYISMGDKDFNFSTDPFRSILEG
jgi:predicted transcriptional regulator